MRVCSKLKMLKEKPEKTIQSILLGIFFLCFGLFASQKQHIDIPPEKQSAEVRLVLVDVIVTKNGKFVTDLTVDDFKLYEDGEEVPIYSFDLMKFSEPEIPDLIQKDEIISPPVPQQKFVFIFDCINSWARDVDALKAEATEELLELVKLGNEVMVLQLTWDDGMEIAQTFTSDEELIRAAVKKAIGTWWETGSQLAVVDGIDPFLDELDFATDLKNYIQAQQLKRVQRQKIHPACKLWNTGFILAQPSYRYSYWQKDRQFILKANFGCHPWHRLRKRKNENL
jgi:hypothetical protein